MSKAEVSYRRPLNSEQLLVLSLLYRFRFGACEYIAEYLGKTNIKVVQKKLRVLEDQEYIAKHYDSSYKLAGRPAEYYLTPKGARLLRDKTNEGAKLANQVTPQGIKNLYKNPSVSLGFITHSLKVLKAALYLNKLYGEKLAIFTRMQMIPFNYLPSWCPDLHLSLKVGAKDAEPKPYFLDVWDGTRPFFVSVRKARAYLNYAEDGDWPEDYDFPSILMICDTDKNQKKLNRQIRKALDDCDDDETVFGITTLRQLQENTKKTNKIWQRIMLDEDVEAVTMENIQ